MTRSGPWQAYAVAIAAGAALWLATSYATGKSEPWDSSAYWTVAYPVAIALSGGLGFAFPQRPWRWALAVMLSQAAVMILAGAGLGLLPLGLVLLAALSLPGIVLAAVAARLRP